jgi:putative restriction endonuclease
MRYWWVNQNQTYRQEVGGGYLWSPKRKRGGELNPFYEFMREVAPGDLVFSFANTRIGAFGVARSYAYEAPKPDEFGSVGRNWEAIGWRVDVEFQEARTPFRPVDWIDVLRPLLPDRYAPLQGDGRGVQSIYLTELPQELALVLADLLGSEVGAIARTEVVAEHVATVTPEVVLWEEHLRREIQNDSVLDETEKEALVLARRGQGLFRERVRGIESCCRVTGVERPEHLRASHIKPWRDSSNVERLTGENGLLLTPSIDHLFDRGFISFKAGGELLVSPVAHGDSLRRMGVPTDRRVDVGRFTEAQGGFLEYHRDAVFLARVER